MEKYVKWRDRPFKLRQNPERWIPEAKDDMIEGSTVYPRCVLLSNDDSEKVKRGKMVFSTQMEAKAAAYEMVKIAVLKEWSIPKERIQEY